MRAELRPLRPSDSGWNLASPVTSCMVLERLAASRSLKCLLCKMDATTLLSQDSGWLKEDARARAISLMIHKCEPLHVLPASRVTALDENSLLREGYL